MIEIKLYRSVYFDPLYFFLNDRSKLWYKAPYWSVVNDVDNGSVEGILGPK